MMQLRCNNRSSRDVKTKLWCCTCRKINGVGGSPNFKENGVPQYIKNIKNCLCHASIGNNNKTQNIPKLEKVFLRSARQRTFGGILHTNTYVLYDTLYSENCIDAALHINIKRNIKQL